MLKVTTDVINTAKVDDVKTAIRKIIVPAGLDYAVEKLCLIGIAGKLDLTGMDIMGESKQIIGLIEGDAIPKLIKYSKKGKFPVDKLMKFYSFDQVNQAFDDFTSGKVIKPVITLE